VEVEVHAFLILALDGVASFMLWTHLTPWVGPETRPVA